MSKKAILLKLTGEIFIDQTTGIFTRTLADRIADQIKQLSSTHIFGIVIGGGAFFRGSKDNDQLKLRPPVAHTVGILGTLMNGLMLYDILYSHKIKSSILCAIECPLAGEPLTQYALDNARADNQVIIFSGGTGNPYVSTDTAAIIRAQQLGATELWKVTNVDGVYTEDPHKDTQATLIKKTTYQEALDKQLKFMDQAALKLAQETDLITHVFNIFKENALIKEAYDNAQGTIILN